MNLEQNMILSSQTKAFYILQNIENILEGQDIIISIQSRKYFSFGSVFSHGIRHIISKNANSVSLFK